MEKERLNKYLASCGICSRREADRLILEGRVMVNGKKAGTGMQVGEEDKILVAGTAIANNGEPLIEGYHKTGVFDGVAVRVLMEKGNISTICPDLDQDMFVKGVV